MKLVFIFRAQYRKDPARPWWTLPVALATPGEAAAYAEQLERHHAGVHETRVVSEVRVVPGRAG